MGINGSSAHSPVDCRRHVTNRFLGVDPVFNLYLNFVFNHSIAEAGTRCFFFLGRAPMSDFLGRNTLISLDISQSDAAMAY